MNKGLNLAKRIGLILAAGVLTLTVVGCKSYAKVLSWKVGDDYNTHSEKLENERKERKLRYVEEFEDQTSLKGIYILKAGVKFDEDVFNEPKKPIIHVNPLDPKLSYSK